MFIWSPSNFLKITYSRLLTFASMDKQRDKIKNHDMNFMGLEKRLYGQECLQNREDLSLNFQHLYKQSSVAKCACNLGALGGRNRRSRGDLLADKLAPDSIRDPILEIRPRGI